MLGKRPLAPLGAALLLPLLSLACADSRSRGPGEVEEVTLGEREWLGGECLGVAAVRELSDGSVLVGEEYLGLLHLRGPGDTARVLGRSGSGPGEYSLVAGLYPLAGDTTLLYDRAGRLLSLSGTEFLGTAQPVEGELGGVDRRGRRLLLRYLRSEPSPGKRGARLRPDSIVLLLYAGEGSDPDTVGRFLAGATASIREGSVVGIFTDHLAAIEPAILFPDGWIAVVHGSSYRVDWRTPEGEWRLGEPIPFEPIEATNREILASLVRFYRHGSGFSQWDPQAMMDRTGRYLDYPATIPPVAMVSQSGSEMSGYFTRVLAAAPDGRLLVRRSQPADSLWTRYDVVDRRGHVNGYLRLGDREEIAGTGVGSLYLVQSDETGCQRLARAVYAPSGSAPP